MVNERVLLFISADPFCDQALSGTAAAEREEKKGGRLCVFFLLERDCTSRSFEYFQFQVQQQA